MTVRELIDILETFNDDMEIRIGMQQNYGSDFSMSIRDVEEYNINAFYGENYRAIVITEGEQCGTVNYYEESDDWMEE